MIRLLIPGEPVPQARPRVTRWGAYDPPKSKEYKKTVAFVAKSVMAGHAPIEGAVRCDILIARAIPKSYTKGKRLSAQHNIILPIQKSGDIDNYAKGIMDGMTGIVWHDDSQVVSLSVMKRWGIRPFALVYVSEEDEDGRKYDYKDNK